LLQALVLPGPQDVACLSVSLDPLQVLEVQAQDLELHQDLGLQEDLDLLADFLDVVDLPVDHVSVDPLKSQSYAY
jgi:hypothetical protein